MRARWSASPASIGSGRTELAHLIVARRPGPRGHRRAGGRPGRYPALLRAAHPTPASCSSDRGAQGASASFLRPGMSPRATHQPRGARRDARDRLHLSTRDKARPTAPTGRSPRSAFVPADINASSSAQLSGGNQQKVLLSRLLATTPKVLILDEPTRGVDVGAKSEIYSIIDNLAKSGTAILVISSDLPEIIGICDRVVVMRAGHIAGEIERGATSP